MSISVEERYHGAVIEIKGKFLGSIQGREFKDIIEKLKESGTVYVVADLGKTEFIDSTGIGVLTSSLTSLRNAGGDMHVANMKDRVHGLFVVTRLLGSAFVDYESVEEALQAFDKTSAETPEEKAS